jgi:glycosyltransferase involved in cell wall biosynthesis
LTPGAHRAGVRIGLVSDTYTPQVNGVTTVVRRIASLLRAQGHEALVVAPRYPTAPGSGSPDPRELRIPSLAFPLYPDIRMSLPPFRQVADFFDASPPDVVHIHTEGALGLAARRWALRRGVPLVTTYHTNFPEYSRHYGVGFLEPLVWRWLQWFHAPARVTFTPGQAVRDDLVRRGLPHVAVWGRGVDPHFFHPGRRDASWRRWLAGSENTVIILHVGRLAHEKNLGVLIEAWRQARDILGQRATFVVAGEGPEARRIEARLPFIRLLGFLPREDLATLYASADVCVFPSHTETCGLVALEAMASGTAVIAADAGGFRESIHSGNTGLLVPAHEPGAYCDAIVALTSDAATRFALAAVARDAALNRDVAHENLELLHHYAALADVGGRRAAPCAA